MRYSFICISMSTLILKVSLPSFSFWFVKAILKRPFEKFSLDLHEQLKSACSLRFISIWDRLIWAIDTTNAFSNEKIIRSILTPYQFKSSYVHYQCLHNFKCHACIINSFFANENIVPALSNNSRMKTHTCNINPYFSNHPTLVLINQIISSIVVTFLAR